MKDSYNSDIKITCQSTLNNNIFDYFNSNKNNNINNIQIQLEGASLLNNNKYNNDIDSINNNDKNNINNYNNIEYQLDGASILNNDNHNNNHYINDNSNSNEKENDIENIHWDKEIIIENLTKSNNIVGAIDSIRIKSLRVLITGCTGFLGSHLLVQLLRIINCETVYCLVRGVKSTFRANEKINNKLKQFELYKQLNEREFQKIIPVIGDFDKERFGLSENEYQHLSKSVHLIINIASNNNLNSTYNECKTTNVNGVKELIKLSTSYSYKRIVHISPSFLSFDNNSFKNNNQLPVYNNDNNSYNGFLNSKSVSEHLINQYSKEFNITNMILRSPFISSNPNSLISQIIETCKNIGKYPFNVEFKTNISSIQWISESIINTIFNDNNWVNNNKGNNNRNLNIYNIVEQPITINEILSTVSKEHKLLPIEFNDWILQLKSTKTNNNLDTLNNNLQFIKLFPNNYKEKY